MTKGRMTVEALTGEARPLVERRTRRGRRARTKDTAAKRTAGCNRRDCRGRSATDSGRKEVQVTRQDLPLNPTAGCEGKAGHGTERARERKSVERPDPSPEELWQVCLGRARRRRGVVHVFFVVVVAM